MPGPYRDRADEFYSGKARIQGYQDASRGLPPKGIPGTNPRLYDMGYHEGSRSNMGPSAPKLPGLPSKFP